jgi:hypothetical protein
MGRELRSEAVRDFRNAFRHFDVCARRCWVSSGMVVRQLLDNLSNWFAGIFESIENDWERILMTVRDHPASSLFISLGRLRSRRRRRSVSFYVSFVLQRPCVCRRTTRRRL